MCGRKRVSSRKVGLLGEQSLLLDRIYFQETDKVTASTKWTIFGNSVDPRFAKKKWGFNLRIAGPRYHKVLGSRSESGTIQMATCALETVDLSLDPDPGIRASRYDMVLDVGRLCTSSWFDHVHELNKETIFSL